MVLVVELLSTAVRSADRRSRGHQFSSAFRVRSIEPHPAVGREVPDQRPYCFPAHALSLRSSACFLSRFDISLGPLPSFRAAGRSRPDAPVVVRRCRPSPDSLSSLLRLLRRLACPPPGALVLAGSVSALRRSLRALSGMSTCLILVCSSARRTSFHRRVPPARSLR